MTAETSNARGKVKVGDRVRATRDGSLFYRYGDCGTVIRIDLDGDFWVRWDNPIVPDSGHGWCISPHNCALVAQRPASVGEEIMVNAGHDVFILPLQPSGLSSGPRFVVHVPGQPASPQRRPYNTSGSLSEYGILPECDAAPAAQAPRACTCHPDDRPDGPCRERYAASECQALAAQAQAANADALDAARYLWLRDREIPEWLDLWHQNPDRIDAAIDQAMKEQA